VFGQFAQQITEMFGYDMVLPMNTGAEAVETSVKLARKWAYMKKGVLEGKAIVLSVEGNFHGRTLGIIRCVRMTLVLDGYLIFFSLA
jgi:ornithine--oxo-acid transaminase